MPLTLLAGWLSSSLSLSTAYYYSILCVIKSGSQLAIVHMFHRPLAQPATGHAAAGIGGTAVDLHVDQQPLATARIVDAQFPTTGHRHPNAQHLTRAQMAVDGCSIV